MGWVSIIRKNEGKRRKEVCKKGREEGGGKDKGRKEGRKEGRDRGREEAGISKEERREKKEMRKALTTYTVSAALCGSPWGLLKVKQ